jgi:hypothetical protein
VALLLLWLGKPLPLRRERSLKIAHLGTAAASVSSVEAAIR